MGKRENLAALLTPLVERMHTGYCWKKTPDGPRRIDVRFTAVQISEHVTGHTAYGLCPISPGSSTCRVACLDLDSHKGDVPFERMTEIANDLALSLALDGYSGHMFTSSGGRGIHIYLTWREPQDAYSVREMLRRILAEHNLKSGTKGVKHGEVEIFPKQDAVPADGYGSMFILPWSGASAPLLGIFHAWDDSAAVPVRTREERSAARVSAQALPAVARLRSALDAIPNSQAGELSYDEWRNIIFAIHAGTEGSDDGLDLAHEFSARASKYDSDFLNNRVWPYIRSDRDGPTITEGTLFARASAEGWEDPTTADDFDAVVPTEAGAHADRLQRDAADGVDKLRFVFVPESEFSDQPAPLWIVEDVIPAADLIVVFGESGSGKSFWTLDLLQAIARGIAWRGKLTTKHRCAYIAAEGAGGFRKRLTAYKREHGLDSTDLYVLPEAPSFLEAAHVKDVIKRLREIGSPRVVVIDTLAQVLPGGAENSSEDMGKLILHCKMVTKHTGAMVILIHHSGKDSTRGARGWSGLRGAVDTEIEIVRAEHDRVATITKQKDGEDGMEFGFKLRRVDLGTNARGNAISSCVVDHGAAVARDKRAQGRLGNVQKIVWQAAIDAQQIDGELPTHTVVIALAASRMVEPVGRDTRPAHAIRALTELAAKGKLDVADNHVKVLGAVGEEPLV